MPSGAKRRKAAKKKKGNMASASDIPTSPASSTTTTHSLGEEELKHHESDRDHDSEQHLTEGEEEVVEKREERGSHLEDNKTIGDAKNESERVEKRVTKEESVVQIEREFKPHDEFGKKGGFSSSSSSGDESHAVEKDIVVIDNAPVDIVEAAPISKIDNKVEEAASDFGMEKVSSPDQKPPADLSASADSSSTSAVIESQLKENEERKLGLKDLVPENKNNEVNNAAAAASDATESVAGESQEKDGVIKDGALVKDSEVLGASDGQPFVASTPRPMQTTSWKSCCGLIEAFTGSNR